MRKTISTTLILTAIFLTLFSVKSSLYAQQCTVVENMIAELRDPDLGAFNIWDTIYGDMNTKEKFIAGMPLANGRFFMVGQRHYFTGQKIELITFEVDKRGRPLWEKKHHIEGLYEITNLLRVDDTFLLIGNVSPERGKNHVIFIFMDDKGEILEQKTLTKTGHQLYAEDAVLPNKADQITLAVTARIKDAAGQRYAMLYKLDKQANPVTDRAYMMGPENSIQSIAPIKNNQGFLVAGYVFTENGQRAGWASMLGSDGNIFWQKQFSRGMSAKLNHADDFIQNYAIFAGESEPTDKGNRAAWLLLLNKADGSIAWQRFYRGKLDFYARDLHAHKDGQITFLIDAERDQGQQETEYVRLITLNPRGIILNNDNYFNSKGASAHTVFYGPNQERIILGSSMVEYQEEEVDQDGELYINKIVTQEAWAAAGAPAEPYTDPCVEPYQFLP